MSKICKDPSDIILGKRQFSPHNCECNCENQKQDFTPMGKMCAGCGHIQRKRLR